MTDDRRFEIELSIDAPTDAVWRALTDPEHVERWFAFHAELDPRPGGAVLWDWGGDCRWPLRVERWEPGRRVTLAYDSAVDDGAGGKVPLFVDFLLSGDRGATTLRLVHSGFGPEAGFDQEFDGISGGWPIELSFLRFHLEVHPDRERRLVHARARVGDEPRAALERLHAVDALALDVPHDRVAEGESFRVDVPGAEPLRCEALIPSRGDVLGGRFVEHGVGTFRTHAFRIGEPPATEVWITAALYDADEETARRYQAAFDAVLARAFPDRLPDPETSTAG